MSDDVKRWLIGEPPHGDSSEWNWIASTPEEALEMLQTAAKAALRRASRGYRGRRLLVVVSDAEHLLDDKSLSLLTGLARDGRHGGVVAAPIAQVATIYEESA